MELTAILGMLPEGVTALVAFLMLAVYVGIKFKDTKIKSYDSEMSHLMGHVAFLTEENRKLRREIETLRDIINNLAIKDKPE